MDSCEELNKFIWKEWDLTLGSRAVHSSCSNRSPHSPSLPRSDPAAHRRCAGGSPCFWGWCDSCGPGGPSCNKQGAGKAALGYPGGCSAAAAAPRPSSFLPSFPQQGAKEKWGMWHGYCCCEQTSFPDLLSALHFSFLRSFGHLSLSAGECSLLGGK